MEGDSEKKRRWTEWVREVVVVVAEADRRQMTKGDRGGGDSQNERRKEIEILERERRQ